MIRKSNGSARPATATADRAALGAASLKRLPDPTLVGPSFHVDGDIRGNEDLVVYGRVAGRIDIGDGVLMVTREGCIEADARARVITIEGSAEGDLHAREQIVVRKSARVRGTLSAPRVALDFGCAFSGSVDTDREERSAPQTGDDSVALFKAAIAAPADSAKR